MGTRVANVTLWLGIAAGVVSGAAPQLTGPQRLAAGAEVRAPAGGGSLITRHASRVLMAPTRGAC
jgi:hypothetical protein